jgi:hypothetical protein
MLSGQALLLRVNYYCGLVIALKCAQTNARVDDPDAYRLASQILDSHRSLYMANQRFWDLLAKQIAAEERGTLREQ